jgi:hypothetical protein
MKCIYIILSILLFVSCNNNQKRGNEIIEEEIIVHAKLDSNLVEGVLKLVERQNYLQFPEIPLEESFIIAMFYIDTPKMDSIVKFSHFHYFFKTDNELIDYKGMLNIKGYNIAIYEAIQESNNFGHNFYNTDSLQQIPLDGFKHYPAKNVINERFRICNGKIEYIGWEVAVPDPENSKVI